MADATAGALTPETMTKLATASATGRLLLATLARWLDVEARPALTALNADMRGLSDEDAERVAKSLPGRDDPAALTDAMATILDAIGQVDGMTAADRRLVRKLAGEWLAG